MGSEATGVERWFALLLGIAEVLPTPWHALWEDVISERWQLKFASNLLT